MGPYILYSTKRVKVASKFVILWWLKTMAHQISLKRYYIVHFGYNFHDFVFDSLKKKNLTYIPMISPSYLFNMRLRCILNNTPFEQSTIPWTSWGSLISLFSTLHLHFFCFWFHLKGLIPFEIVVIPYKLMIIPLIQPIWDFDRIPNTLARDNEPPHISTMLWYCPLWA